MASPQIDPVQTVPPRGPAPPRKRRKRTAAVGAAADCFACQSSSLKCDRRRPYCSQCTEQGKDCSGYKTQLTWGVGVASRGKLRGLSLPIAGSTQRATPTTSPTKQRQNAQRSIKQARPQSPIPKIEPVSPTLHRINHESNTASSGSTIPSLPVNSCDAWGQLDAVTVHPSAAHSYSVKAEQFDQMPPMYQFGNLQQHISNHYAPASPASSSNGFPFKRHISPAYYGQSPPDASYLTQPAASASPLPNSTSASRSYRIPDLLSPEPTYVTPSITQTPPYQTTSFPYVDALVAPPAMDPTALQPVNDIVETEEADEVEEIGRGNLEDEVAIIDDYPAFSSPLPLDLNFLLPYGPMSTIGKTPRMQYLINYYAEVISPVIVAFDGPTNPYRTQILRLASDSETLQHAISALSASNLRQRREIGGLSTGKTDPARRSSMAHLTLTDEAFHQAAFLSPQEQAREETYHRGLAIQSLNAQLANPVLRKNDSILATLLILCLFHMCDSGIAKFQTQFAGVKKLLSLRGSELGVDTKEAVWFTRMFTWFDSLAATVNDREGQLRGHHLDITALSDEEWALENLAGCDGQLFKSVAKLGRLNVLSQGEKVDEMPALVSKPFPNIPFLDEELTQIDGNGWNRMASDENLFNLKTATRNTTEQFWREWREVRQELQRWQLKGPALEATSTAAPNLTPEQRLDLNEISESFRYSALLYTERLAYPEAASSEKKMQDWVRQSLAHIRLVKSDVYLLWPLFITGSECVQQCDINLIRERCTDIQKDSGFQNNKSCLELLEKLWKENPAVVGHEKSLKRKQPASESPKAGKGLRFSGIMKREANDGEYIVI